MALSSVRGESVLTVRVTAVPGGFFVSEQHCPVGMQMGIERPKLLRAEGVGALFHYVGDVRHEETTVFAIYRDTYGRTLTVDCG
jgi:hypothetical protein